MGNTPIVNKFISLFSFTWVFPSNKKLSASSSSSRTPVIQMFAPLMEIDALIGFLPFFFLFNLNTVRRWAGTTFLFLSSKLLLLSFICSALLQMLCIAHLSLIHWIVQLQHSFSSFYIFILCGKELLSINFIHYSLNGLSEFSCNLLNFFITVISNLHHLDHNIPCLWVFSYGRTTIFF